MRNDSRAISASALLVACACGVGTTQTASTTAPKVVNVLAVDVSGTLPDVLLWSGYAIDPDTGQPPQVGSAFPIGYAGMRVEFDQTLDPSTIANDITFGPRSGPNSYFTYCAPMAAASGGNVVGLADSGRQIGVSVCYTPNALVGIRPNIYLSVGANAIDASQPSPFTCKDFTIAPPTKNLPPPPSTAGVDVLASGKAYTLQLAAAGIKAWNGMSLTPPSGGSSVAGSWDSAGNFSFTTSSFAVTSIGFVDPTDGFVHYPKKFFPGFQKSKFDEPARPINADKTPLSVTFTAAVEAGKIIVSTSLPATGSITVTRSDGSLYTDLTAKVNTNDAKQVDIVPAGTWEPNQTYTLTVSSPLGGKDQIALASNVSANFVVADAPVAAISTTPVAGSLGVVPVDYEAASSLAPSILFQYPVDPATVTAANVTLTTAGNPVAGTAAIVPKSNNQVVRFTPTQRLNQGTTFTLGWSNLTSKSTVPSLSGKAFPASTSPLTTAYFHKLVVGIKATANPKRTTSIASSTAAGLTLLTDGTLRVGFTDLAYGVVDASGNNLKALRVFEGTGPGATQIPDANVQIAGETQAAPAIYPPPDTVNSGYASYLVNLTGYTPKLGTNYQIKLTPAIKDSAGNLVHTEGCTSSDCTDVVGFKTSALTPAAIKTDDTILSAVTFKVSFNAPLDPNSFSAVLADQALGAAGSRAGFRLYRVDPVSGSLTELADASGNPQLSCALSSATITCTATVALTLNAPYLFSATFTAVSPARVTASVNGYQVDTQNPPPPAPGPTFVGALRTTNFVTRCGP
jgi:hypothetical protein